jgi:ectoine hydroxylase-related dioxygenase (phytanoyl-CoA dioxygenase family)
VFFLCVEIFSNLASINKKDNLTQKFYLLYLFFKFQPRGHVRTFTSAFLCLSFLFCANVKCDTAPVALTPASNAQEWQAQKDFFQKNGYLWIKNFFSHEQVQLLRSWADEVNTASETMLMLAQSSGRNVQSFTQIPGTLIIVPEAANPLMACRAEDMLTCYPDLHHFIAGTVTAYIGKMMNEPYVLFKDKINFKWPGGGAFTPHQDFPAYEPFGPREHVTVMVSIDPATLENGCLHVAKNWRETFLGEPDVNAEDLEAGRAVLPYVTGGSMHGSIQPKYSDKITWLPLETSPCDLVMINSFVPHYSEPNRSQHSRRAMFFTHNRLREGEHRRTYYHAKRYDPLNPTFHFATPTKARDK